MTTQILFVAFSHSLTEGQIADAKASLGIEKIILLKEVAPELQIKMSQIPATATISQIKDLAIAVVDVAAYHEATHFYVAGEPAFTMHSALEAASKYKFKVVSSTTERVSKETAQPDGSIVKTAVFQHVQWRPMF